MIVNAQLAAVGNLDRAETCLRKIAGLSSRTTQVQSMSLSMLPSSRASPLADKAPARCSAPPVAELPESWVHEAACSMSTEATKQLLHHQVPARDLISPMSWTDMTAPLSFPAQPQVSTAMVVCKSMIQVLFHFEL